MKSPVVIYSEGDADTGTMYAWVLNQGKPRFPLTPSYQTGFAELTPSAALFKL